MAAFENNTQGHHYELKFEKEIPSLHLIMFNLGMSVALVHIGSRQLTFLTKRGVETDSALAKSAIPYTVDSITCLCIRKEQAFERAKCTRQS